MNRQRFDDAWSREGFTHVRAGKITPRTPAKRRMVLASVQNDYLVCNVFMPDGVTINTNQTYYVMKPYKLQYTPWNGVTDADGILYAYTSVTNRTASKSGFTNENQQLTPDYLVGDWIMAELMDEGLTLPDGPGEGAITRWIDSNPDGRCWAVLS